MATQEQDEGQSDLTILGFTPLISKVGEINFPGFVSRVKRGRALLGPHFFTVNVPTLLHLSASSPLSP